MQRLCIEQSGQIESIIDAKDLIEFSHDAGKFLAQSEAFQNADFAVAQLNHYALRLAQLAQRPGPNQQRFHG
jgi:hypothetical protein